MKNIAESRRLFRKSLQLTFAVFVFLAGWFLLVALTPNTLASPTVPEEIKQPGTQPGEVSGFASPDMCDNCHGGTPNPDFEPDFGWRGSMMGNATRDPIFWATVAIAEQDFIPNSDPNQRGGSGDLCIRCHSVGGWLNGHSTPTDGSGLSSNETDGVECEFCHLLVNPDPPVNVAGTTEVQNPPFEAYDPVTGEPYYGSGQYVINGGGTRLGPYSDPAARHPAIQSDFVRQGEFCGTCHDVSNPAVGDLAHNNGAQEIPLDPGTFSGVLGSPIDGKAAFNNPPYKYGVVERTFSEWTSSVYPAFRVNDYPALPADLQVAGGALDVAYHRAFDARGDADYEDGAPRFYTCQTCHMSASTGVGCNKSGVPTRTDLPRHDLTGGGYWIPDVVQYQDAKGTLLMGGGLSSHQTDALNAGALRAENLVKSAASVSGSQVGSSLRVRVTNLTAHKLISGYPEGRRMWLNVRWLDAGGALIAENGAYGPIGRTVTDLDGVDHPVESLLDLHDTRIYGVEPGMTQEWANQLLGLGYDSAMPLAFDRMTDAVSLTLGDLAAEPPGSSEHTFHFVINNTVTHDTRIPPYGMTYDAARIRNILPVPKDQYGNPGPGGTYNYWDDADFSIPAGAVTAEVRLYYQQTSWEYIQFLWLANDGLGPFLGNEGVNMLDAWANTGMNPPLEISFATVALSSAAGVPGAASHQEIPAEQMHASWNKGTGAIDVTYTPACDAADHTIYFGDLSLVSTYDWSDAACNVGVSGAASFTDNGLADLFFVIVGNDSVKEGSYGRDSAGLERPEDVGTPVCDTVQDLAGVVCE